MVVQKLDQITRGEPRKKLLLHEFGVRRPHAKRDERAHVAENGIAHAFLHLARELVRDRQPVLAHFGVNFDRARQSKDASRGRLIARYFFFSS